MKWARLRATVLAGAVAGTTGAASASFPVYAGAGTPNGEFDAYRNPRFDQVITFRAGLKRNSNAGVSAVTVDEKFNAAQVGPRALRWGPGLTLTELNPGAAYGFTQTSVSPSGAILGQQHTAGNNGRIAGYYAPGGITFTALPTLPNPAGANPYDVALEANANNVFVGVGLKRSGANSVGSRGIRWTNGVAQELQTLNTNGIGFGESFALGVNASGVAVGGAFHYSTPASTNPTSRAVRWNAGSGTPVELQPFAFQTSGFTFARAVDINAGGTVIGTSLKFRVQNDTYAAPTKWAPGSTIPQAMGELPAPTGYFIGAAEPFALNDAGVAVGRQALESATFADRVVPVRWSPSGEVAELLRPTTITGTSLDGNATDINALGTAAGFIKNTSNIDHAVIWLPGSDVGFDLNAVRPPKQLAQLTGWNFLHTAEAVSDTGFVSGIGEYDYGPSNGGPSDRSFTMLVPDAGTYGRGDANFDTRVDFDDLVRLAQNYGNTNNNQNINVADFDLDKSIDFDDLVKLAQNYGLNAPSLTTADFAADWALAQSLVPEPGTAVFALSGLTVLRRRSRG